MSGDCLSLQSSSPVPPLALECPQVDCTRPLSRMDYMRRGIRGSTVFDDELVWPKSGHGTRGAKGPVAERRFSGLGKAYHLRVQRIGLVPVSGKTTRQLRDLRGEPVPGPQPRCVPPARHGSVRPAPVEHLCHIASEDAIRLRRVQALKLSRLVAQEDDAPRAFTGSIQEEHPIEHTRRSMPEKRMERDALERGGLQIEAPRQDPPLDVRVLQLEA